MVKVRYRRNEFAHSLSIVGHAGYDALGKDIVCAGVSAIVYTLLGFLHHLPDWESRLTAAAERGMCMVCWRGTGREEETAFQMAVMGLAQLAHGYPQCVKMEHL